MRIRSFRTGTLLLTCLLGTWATRAGIVLNTTVPIDLQVEIDCDGDSSTPPEDELNLSGGLHILITETTNKAGGVVDTFHFQPMNVSGIGSITGDTYQAVGLTRGTDTVTGANGTSTFVNNFYMIGQKSGIKYLVHETFHATVVAGQVVVTVDEATVRCL